MSTQHLRSVRVWLRIATLASFVMVPISVAVLSGGMASAVAALWAFNAASFSHSTAEITTLIRVKEALLAT
jgi:hypothetical protein